MHRTIGDGATCKVKIGYDTVTKQEVAIKIMKDVKLLYVMQTELDIINGLDKHPNIVKLIAHGIDVYEKLNGKKNEVAYIVFELASGGELY